MLGPLRICWHFSNKNLERWSHESFHHPAIFEYLGPSHYYKINLTETWHTFKLQWWGITNGSCHVLQNLFLDTKWLYHTEFHWKEVPMPLAIGSISHSYSRQHCNLAFGISWISVNIDNTQVDKNNSDIHVSYSIQYLGNLPCDSQICFFWLTDI